MKHIKSIITASLFTLTAITATAQNSESGYFVRGNLYSHDLNPAFCPAVNDSTKPMNYVAMPILGNVTVNMMGNIGIRDVLFKRGGSTVTFMHPDVTKDEFLSGVKGSNRINEDFFMQVLGAGFRGFHGYNTIEINVRENVAVSVPGSILELAKTGLTNQTYDIGGLKANSDAYGEIAFGHSHKIGKKLRIGAKVKFLLGFANFNANVNSGTITLGTDGYTATTDAELNASMKGLQFKVKSAEYKTNAVDEQGKQITERRSYINSMDVNHTGINGFGVAFDFGAEYKILDDLKVSLAFNDVGFIHWNENHYAYSKGDINIAEYNFNADSKAWNSFDNMFTTLGDQMSRLYQLKSDEFDANGNRIKDDSGSRTSVLGATMRAGVEYAMPFYKPLTVGLLNTTRIQGALSWTDFRLSANVAPCKVFSASGTIAMGTNGFSFGGVLNLHCKGFSLFLATDRTITKMAKQGVPLNSNGSFSIGMNFPFN